MGVFARAYHDGIKRIRVIKHFAEIDLFAGLLVDLGGFPRRDKDDCAQHVVDIRLVGKDSVAAVLPVPRQDD